MEHDVLHKKCWADEENREIYLIEPKLSSVKKLSLFLFKSNYKRLPQWSNLYVYYALRKKLIEMDKASGPLATTNVVINIKEKNNLEQELDILLMSIHDNSIGIIESTISGSEKELTEKERKINAVRVELEKYGFNVKVADVITPSPTLQKKIEEIAIKLV